MTKNFTIPKTFTAQANPIASANSDDMCQILRCSLPTLYRMERDGRIPPGVRVGRRKIWPAEAIANLLQNNSKQKIESKDCDVKTETKSPDLGLTIKSTNEWVKVQRYGRYTLTVSRNTQNPAELVLLDLIELLTHKTESKNEDQQ